jgi:hypothetical protein
VYGRLPHSGVLPENYEATALPIVNEQLERAGVRLAIRNQLDCFRCIAKDGSSNNRKRNLDLFPRIGVHG